MLFFDQRSPRSDGKPNSKALWIYDFRTNRHFTLRKSTLKNTDLDDIDSLPPPDEIAAEIVENLQAALEQFAVVAEALSATKNGDPV